MSVPVTSQAMPGPSPQLSQDVATPHPLQVGEQQALQGQPPLQHIPSHQPQTVAQSHDTGGGPPQAMAQLHGTVSRGYFSQHTLQPVATSLPITPQAAHIPCHGLQPSRSLHQVISQPMTSPTSIADQQSTAQHVQPEPVAPHPPTPWTGRGMPTPHTYSITQWPPGQPESQLYSQYPSPRGLTPSNQCNWNTASPLISSPPQPQTPHQPLSLVTTSSFEWPMSLPWAVCRPHPSPVLSPQYVNQPPPKPQLSWSQDMATPHHPRAGRQAIRGQPYLQYISSHESYGASSESPSQARRVLYESSMAQYIAYIKSVYEESVLNELSVVKWPPTSSKVYINLVCVDRTTYVSKQEMDECTRAMVEDGNVDVVLGKKTPIDFSDIAKDMPTYKKNKGRIVLVEGAPGVGKSTLAWEFCRRWERGEIAQQCKLVLLLRLRDKEMSEAQSLVDLLYHPSKAVVQAVEDELIATLGANTLIILEGFDELPSTCRTQSSVFFRLINGTLLPHATVLVTSRPWATQDLLRECYNRLFQHIEILGFTGKQVEEYVTSVFMADRKLAGDKARVNIEEVMTYIKKYPQIKGCMYIPLNSAIVVGVYQESKAGKCILPRTLTELYSALVQTLLVRYLYGHPDYGQKRWKIQSFKKDLPQDVYSKLLAISELAYSGICTDQEGSVQLIYYNLPPDFETLGLMQSVPQLYVTQGEDMSHNFLHLTVQEFLAALHISNMTPEKQLEHFQRHWRKGRYTVVLKFLAGLTELLDFSEGDMKSFLLEECSEDQIAKKYKYNITAGVVLISPLVNWMFETQREDIVPVVLQKKTVEYMGERGLTPLDYYSLGYCIVKSHSQWVLTMQDDIEEKEVRMLVAGVDSKCDTSARVVGLRYKKYKEDVSGDYWPLSISAEALNVLFFEMKNVIHLQELHLQLPAECSSISWPNLSGLQVLCLGISGEKNWRLDNLLPHLSLLESLTVEAVNFSSGTAVVLEDCEAIALLLSSSNCLKCLNFECVEFFYTIDPESMEPITKALSENESLPLRNLGVECGCTFSDTAAHHLALFITNSTTLHHLSIVECRFSAHGLLELAQTIHHSPSLQKKKLNLTCTVDGDDEAADYAQLSVDYPYMVDWLNWEVKYGPLDWSHITDRGAHAIGTVLHNSKLLELYLSHNIISDTGSATLAQALCHNSTLMWLGLSGNSIGDAGSAALAQALHHNSTLRGLNLSGNDAIGEEGTHQLVQALTVNTSVVILVLPRRCEEYATQCPQYSEVSYSIRFR